MLRRMGAGKVSLEQVVLGKRGETACSGVEQAAAASAKAAWVDLGQAHFGLLDAPCFDLGGMAVDQVGVSWAGEWVGD